MPGLIIVADVYLAHKAHLLFTTDLIAPGQTFSRLATHSSMKTQVRVRGLWLTLRQASLLNVKV